jgi:hypothetical protein
LCNHRGDIGCTAEIDDVLSLQSPTEPKITESIEVQKRVSLPLLVYGGRSGLVMVRIYSTHVVQQLLPVFPL